MSSSCGATTHSPASARSSKTGCAIHKRNRAQDDRCGRSRPFRIRRQSTSPRRDACRRIGKVGRFPLPLFMDVILAWRLRVSGAAESIPSSGLSWVRGIKIDRGDRLRSFAGSGGLQSGEPAYASVWTNPSTRSCWFFVTPPSVGNAVSSSTPVRRRKSR
jgi:hypothetical protein